MNSKLYVGNLSETTREDTLWSLFSHSGTVVSVDLIRDRVSLRSKGYAFIVMGSPLEAAKAAETLNGRTVDNRQIHVSFAQRREDLRDSSNRDHKTLQRTANRTRKKR